MKHYLGLPLAVLALAGPVHAQTLVYQGNHTGGVTCAVKGANLALGCVMYDNFTVGGDGWNVTGLYGNFYQPDVDGMAPWSTAYWEIRTGMAEEDAGTLLFGGADFVTAATRIATGRSFVNTSDVTFYEYTAQINFAALLLEPGTYWIGLSPVVLETAPDHLGAYVAQTNGSSGINSQADGFSLAWINGSSDFVPRDHDFSYGVLGSLYIDDGTGNPGGPGDGDPGDPGNPGGPGNPDATVPEPATLTLLATGMAALGAARRKRA